MSLNYTTPLDDEVFSLSFANHQPTEHALMGQEYSPSLMDETKYIMNSSVAVPREFDSTTAFAQDETMFSLDSTQENNYKHQAMNNVQDCRMAVSARTTQSCDGLTDLYANAAQQNYRLWLSSF